MIAGQHQWTKRGPDGRPVKNKVEGAENGEFACYKCGLVQQVVSNGSRGRPQYRSHYFMDGRFFTRMPQCFPPHRRTWHERLMTED